MTGSHVVFIGNVAFRGVVCGSARGVLLCLRGESSFLNNPSAQALSFKRAPHPLLPQMARAAQCSRSDSTLSFTSQGLELVRDD